MSNRTEQLFKGTEWGLALTCALYAVVGAVVTIGGCVTEKPRYVEGSTQVNLPKDIYTQAIDPCDPVYSVMSKPLDSWTAQFGNSERSALAYQHALARQQRAELRQMIVDVNNSVTELTDTQLWLMKVIGRDPNDT